MTPRPSLPLDGVWLPLITPFRDGELDAASLRRLARHYAGRPIRGFILGATTGEGLTLDEGEARALCEIVAGELAVQGAPRPIMLGLTGSDTRALAERLRRTADWPIQGVLVACPPYSRPSQAGLQRHFEALSDVSPWDILIYNIPYRTGVNMGNETMLRLAERANIVGVKDCCADPAQSAALIRDRPAGFAVLTGEDAVVYDALRQGADGAILASAHVATGAFAEICRRAVAAEHEAAAAAWDAVRDLPRLLFSEPSPSAIKHWVWRAGLIDSPELRLPMTPVTAGLAARVDAEVKRGVWRA